MEQVQSNIMKGCDKRFYYQHDINFRNCRFSKPTYTDKGRYLNLQDQHLRLATYDIRVNAIAPGFIQTK